MRYFASKNRIANRKVLGIGLLGLGILFMTRAAQAIIIDAGFSNNIPFETLVPNETTIDFQVDSVVNNIQIDIYRLRDVSDVPGPTNQVASLVQTGLPSGNHTLVWDALWPVGGVLGRQGGLFKIILTDIDTGDKFAVSDYLTITSVDIHSVNVRPSFDANFEPALPYVISYALAKDSLVTVRVLDSNSTVVRTLASSSPQFGELVKSTNTLLWNGLDESDTPVPLGIYTITIDARDPSNADTAIQRTAPATIQTLANLDSDAQETFEKNAFVYPNPIRTGTTAACGGEGCFHFLAVRPSATIALKIYTIDGTLVREDEFTELTTGNVVTFPWDVTNESGNKLGRGLYYFVARETDAQGTLQAVKKFAVIR
jgi:flagellar hook assembly protein FlgD